MQKFTSKILLSVAVALTIILLATPLKVGLSQTTSPAVNTLTFHGDSQRLGWNAAETALTPTSVSSGSFGPLWNSPQFDSLEIGGTIYAPHLYASPLYVDNVVLSGGQFANSTVNAVFAATNNGFVYAVNASPTSGDNPIDAGTILWSQRLGTPTIIPGFDGDLPLGVLSTPIIDLNASPPRLYVASVDASAGWQVFALDLTNGNILPGWPIAINDEVLAPVNQNGPAKFQGTLEMSQRGALNLSPDRNLLYVPFGAYNDGGAGWMVTIDTLNAVVKSAFSGAPSSEATANGGMWASGGAAVDNEGRVYVTSGNSPTESANAPGVWGQSLLVWSGQSTLQLSGTYTPFNYCAMDEGDIDLAGGGPLILPELDASTTSTPHLVTFGGKQGNVYLVDRDNLPGRLDQRQPCSTDSTTDGSLLPPDPQPQFGTRGPLNVFGPYSENFGNSDYAKGRTTPAYFQGSDGTPYLFVSGTSKAAINSTTSVPPSFARLRIVTAPNQPAYLAVDATENSLTFLTPGSPVVTSNGSSNAIVWVLVANITRSQSLTENNVPHPILYAIDATTLSPLWNSTPEQLNVGGKYNLPAIAHGVVFVGTDRIQAFGLASPES